MIEKGLDDCCDEQSFISEKNLFIYLVYMGCCCPFVVVTTTSLFRIRWFSIALSFLLLLIIMLLIKGVDELKNIYYWNFIGNNY